MKLILTSEVSGLGASGDIVEVKDGYGRSFLVPRGLALRWTRGAERQVSDLRRGRAAREVRDAGRVVTIVGIAPVKPAEFIVFKLMQSADVSEIENLGV